MFQPLVPVGGLAGFRFLERTMETQVSRFEARPDMARDIAYFQENAGKAETAEDLVSDPRLLRVALGAFGLGDQVDKRAFIRRILEDGTISEDALANRLATPVWKDLSRTLGYGDVGGLLGLESVREDIVSRFVVRSFEEAVGAQAPDLEAALAFRRGIGEIANGEAVDNAGWLQILGRTDLRRVVETAFGLPTQFGAIDLDQQRAELERISRREFGVESPRAFQDPEAVDDLLRRFLAISAARSGPSALTPGATALMLLQSGGVGSGAQAGLFASRFL